MNKKTVYVNRVKVLANGKNDKGEDNSSRFSLYENGEHFAIAVVSFTADGKPDEERIKEIQALKGKEIIAIERAIETADGTAATQWYLLTEEAVDSYAAREAGRDVNVLIAQKKEVLQAANKVQLAQAMKAAGAAGVTA